MLDNNDIARDLTVIYLQNNFDTSLSPKELIENTKKHIKCLKIH